MIRRVNWSITTSTQCVRRLSDSQRNRSMLHKLFECIRTEMRKGSHPKPVNETGGKLSPAPRCGPLDGSRRRTNAKERAQRRANHYSFAAGRGRQEGERCLPGDGSVSAGVLQLEAEVRGTGSQRVTGASAVARRESETEDSGGKRRGWSGAATSGGKAGLG